MRHIDRREFLKLTPVAAGAATSLAGATTARPVNRAEATDAPARPRIGDAAFTPSDYPIHSKPHFEVELTDRFWKTKVDRNAAVTIPFEIRKLTERPRQLNGNVLEAAILSLKTHPDSRLQALLDRRIDELRAEEWTGNSGFEVAVTHYNMTGRRDLLDRAIRSAAQLYDDFVANDPPFSGGERDAINCIQLYRATHEKRHLALAKHYLDIRGLENSVNRSRHNQSYKPVLEQSEAVGHAVNGVSLMVSLADIGVLTGLRPYLDAAHRMWSDIVERKLYVTGGVGTTGNEGFGEAYSLPNMSAYAETCAVLMFITLNHRLFLATGDGKFIDVMERGMYNNAVDGVSTSGDRFFYVNRLASAGDGRDVRWERASLECCPPNLVRFLASMPGIIYAQGGDDSVYVNLYASSRASFRVESKPIELTVTSDMPWGGTSSIAVRAPEPITATIKLRIPGWARNRPVPSALYAYADRSEKTASIAVNGERVTAAADQHGYVSIARRWRSGDVITLDLPMDVRRVIADDRVTQNRRRVAIERGPIVYCCEWPDVDDGRVLDILIESRAELTPEHDASRDGGATIVRTRGTRVANPSAERRVTLIPYYLWANRGAGEMTVWLSSTAYAIGDVGPAGGFIFYENPNYATDGWRFLEAAPFDQSAGAKWGCFRHVIAGARGTAVGTGKQNAADMLRACTDSGSAAALCAALSVNGVTGWFLPSRDELALMYRNLKAAGLGDFRDGGAADNFTYWTSSQQTADMANHIDFADAGRQHYDDKDFPRRVRAIRQI
jgi:uncharacterized protein